MTKPTFLVALDVTEDAAIIVSTARRLANQCDARLLCLSIVRPLAGVYGSLYIAPYTTSGVSFEEEALRHTHQKLLDLATAYGVSEDDVYTKIGTPAAEIRATASELQCDLVVMGTHARTGLGRLLGSTANAVLHGLICDAYLVKVPTEATDN